MIAWMQADLMDRIRRGFRGYLENPEAPVTVLILVGLLFLLGLILHALFSRKGRGERQVKRRFRKFAQASGLTAAETVLLQSAARVARLEDSPAIFFRRSAFEDGMRRLDAPKGQVETLRSKVFGP